MKKVFATLTILLATIPNISSAAIIAQQADDSSAYTFLTTNTISVHAPVFTASGNYSLGSPAFLAAPSACGASSTGRIRFSANIPSGRNLSAYIFHDTATPTPHGLNYAVWGNLPTCTGFIPGNGVMTNYTMPVTLPIPDGGGLPDTGILNGQSYHVVFGEQAGYPMEITFKTDPSNNVYFQLFDDASDATSSVATTTPPCVAGSTPVCNSNVMFLPGIEASRLYSDGGVNKLWEPDSATDVLNLFLDPSGSGVQSNVFTRDVVDELPLTHSNIYASFLNDLAVWKNTDHIIADYKAVPYDWRLALNDILDYGHQFPDGSIYYSGAPRASSTPYVIQTLRDLAETSRTGKVTVIAHSNGGLVAKALIKRLKDTQDPLLDKIDVLILVDVPQVGTPQAIGAALHGYDQALPKEFLPILVTDESARAFASTSPMAYHLLPSTSYFSGDGIMIQTPPVTFDDGSLTQQFVTAYGRSIGNSAELHDFLLGNEGRPQAGYSNVQSPSKLSPTLLSYAEAQHASLDDNSAIPASIQVHEIGGWGNDTLATIRYYTGFACSQTNPIGVCTEIAPVLQYDPQTVIDGDGTVITASSLAMSTSSPNVKRWWVDLKSYNDNHFDRDHASVLEVQQLRELLNNLLTKSPIMPVQYISADQPSIPNTEHLIFKLHSPLILAVTDSLGNEISVSTSTILGAQYRRFGEVQYISIPADSHPVVHLAGYAAGSFTLEADEVLGNTMIASTTFAAIPSTPATKGTISFPDGTVANATQLSVDENGDGTVDQTFLPKLNSVVKPDVTPPITSLMRQGVNGSNGWYTSSVSIIFNATDTESGVRATYFSLDGSATSSATSTTINTEGLHTLTYYSVDNAGNREMATFTTIKIDKTAPEGVMSISTSTKDLAVTGFDNLSTTTVTKSVNSVSITDEAGNTTILNFTKTYTSNLLALAKLTSIRYGTSAPVALSTQFVFLWNPLTNPLILLSQTVVADSTFGTEAAYDKSKNKTTVLVKRKGIQIQATTVTGLALIKLTTSKGAIGYSW